MDGGQKLGPLMLVSAQIRGGAWTGHFMGGSGVLQVAVTHLGKPVPDVEVSERGTGGWQVRVPIPQEAIADGVQVFVVTDQISGEKIADFTLLAGEVLGDDMRAEVELLRAELDMLKRAFRRHCVETGQS